jgi:hypothetical protein
MNFIAKQVFVKKKLVLYTKKTGSNNTPVLF